MLSKLFNILTIIVLCGCQSMSGPTEKPLVSLGTPLPHSKTADELRYRAVHSPITHPFLWKVTGKEGFSSYLFGTIHHGVGMGELPRKTVQLVQQSQNFVMESRPEDALPLCGEPQTMVHGDLKKELSPAAWYRLQTGTFLPQKYLQVLTPESAFQSYSETVAVRSQARVRRVSLDQQLKENATSNKISIHYLESADEVSKWMEQYRDKLPEESWSSTKLSEFLEQEAHTYEQKVLKDFYKLIIAYKSGDLRQIAAILEEEPALMDVLLRKRNQVWIERLVPIFEQGASFAAVGVGHMIGEDNLVDLLMARGFKVERVK